MTVIIKHEWKEKEKNIYREHHELVSFILYLFFPTLIFDVKQISCDLTIWNPFIHIKIWG